jgi:uncharacterized membrane protein YdbT with pleckstrin-like domain
MITTLKKDEELLISIRQHWIRLLPPTIIWLLTSIVLIWFLNGIGMMMASVFLLIPLYEYVNWRNNLLSITNLRVIDECGFITKYAKERPIDKIINIEYDQSVMGRLMGFGNIEIQTAAENIPVRFKFIQNPGVLKNTITNAQEEFKNISMVAQANHLAKAIASERNLQTPINYAPSDAVSIANEIQKLYELYQKGALTIEEYNAQKTKLLNA